MADDPAEPWLPPTQYLLMEVLAARHRLGEHVWTFPNACRPAARRLEAAGLIRWKDSPAPGCFTAWMTDHGCRQWLMTGYVTPVPTPDVPDIPDMAS
jgi:hypothetical protein